jgi:hypothetical protein
MKKFRKPVRNQVADQAWNKVWGRVWNQVIWVGRVVAGTSRIFVNCFLLTGLIVFTNSWVEVIGVPEILRNMADK